MTFGYRCKLFAAFCFFFYTNATFAQGPGTGALRGCVLDSQTHAVANAEIEVVNQATHISRKALTNNSGEYGVALLPPGRHSVRASAAEFTSATSDPGSSS